MPKVSEEHRASRRREIIAAAIRCFARNGFQASSMSDIIAESGLSAGAIYGYFASKRELVQAVAAEVYDPTRRELVERVDEHGDPLHPIDFAGRFALATMAKIGDPSIVVQVWGQAAIDEGVRQLFDVVYGRLLEAFREQIELWISTSSEPTVEAAERSRQLATVVAGIVQGGIVQSAFVPGFDIDAYLRAARPLFDTAAG